MNPIKFLHCADVHLGAAVSYLGAAAAKRRAEILLTFEKILDTARERKVDLLLIAGDLFDSNRIETELADRVFAGMASIAPVKVIICAGNHDPLTADSPYLTKKLPENVYVFAGEDGMLTLDDLNVHIYGRSFTEVYMKGRERFSITPPDDGFCNLLVLHGDTSGDLSSEYNGITNDYIRTSGMDYIALGHIHKRSEPQYIGGTCFAYCGCPEGLGFDETGEKGVYYGELKKGECMLEFIPLCRRQHIERHIDISACHSAAEIIAFATDDIHSIDRFADHLYKIVLTGSTDEGAEVPADELASRISSEVYFAKVRDNTHVRADLETLSHENSLKGIFVRKMLERRAKTESAQLPVIDRALDIGLRAFYSEVKYRDNH